MSEVNLRLPETEALSLYRHLHRWPEGQDLYCEAYRQLQNFFFQTLTVEEITELLEREE